MESVVTGEAVVLEVPVARFPSRLLAIIIDLAVQVVLLAVLLFVVGLAAEGGLDDASTAAIALVVTIGVIVGYPTVFETLSRGKTLGKLALGLRVVGDDGGPERFRQALVRALAGVIEIWALAGAPALVASLLSAKGKRLGDLFAGTFVIQERLGGKPGNAITKPPPAAGQAGPAHHHAAPAGGLGGVGRTVAAARRHRRHGPQLPEPVLGTVPAGPRGIRPAAGRAGRHPRLTAATVRHAPRRFPVRSPG